MTQTASTQTATGDLSRVGTFTDAQLDAELAAARTLFAAARVNDPRRSSITYIDSKLAVTVLGDEHQRRAVARRATRTTSWTVTVDDAGAEGPGRPCGAACAGARTVRCTCECGGAQHGLLRRPARTSTPATRARAWTVISQPSTDDPF